MVALQGVPPKGVLEVPAHSTSKFEGSFSYFATKVWNKLPPEIRILDSLSKFKRKMQSVSFSNV